MKKQKIEPKLIYESTMIMPNELSPAVYYGMPDEVVYRIADTEMPIEAGACPVMFTMLKK